MKGKKGIGFRVLFFNISVSIQNGCQKPLGIAKLTPQLSPVRYSGLLHPSQLIPPLLLLPPLLELEPPPLLGAIVAYGSIYQFTLTSLDVVNLRISVDSVVSQRGAFKTCRRAAMFYELKRLHHIEARTKRLSNAPILRYLKMVFYLAV
jgi:hypothetical protein